MMFNPLVLEPEIETLAHLYVKCEYLMTLPLQKKRI
jgi:hypothetical protein